LADQLDSVFIEGHTDNQPVTSYGVSGFRFKDNWELSALRAVYTYYKLIPERPLLFEMRNSNEQPIFNVSGYGEGRPLPGHHYEEPTSDADNRRIDIRFIMTPPSETMAEKALKEAGVL
jgi:flagellar motor protein MotB